MAALGLTLLRHRLPAPADALLLFALVYASNYSIVDLPKRKITFSYTLPVLYAGILMFGPASTLPMLLGRVVFYLQRRPEVRKLLFNTGRDALCISLPAWICQIFGAPLGLSSLSLGHALPIAASWLFLAFLDWATLGILQSLLENLPPWKIRFSLAEQADDWLLLPLGLLMVMVWTSNGPFHLIWVLIPMGSAIVVFRQVVKRTEESKELRLLYQMARQLTSSLDLPRILNFLAIEVLRVLPCDHSALYLRNDNKSSLEIQAEAPAGVAGPLPRIFETTDEPLGCVATSGESFIGAFSLGKGGEGSLLAVPLQAEGETVGVLVAYRTVPSAFLEGHKEFLTILGNQAASAILNAKLYQETLRAQAQLVESSKMAALGQLSAGVAHETNNPLGAILNSAELLRHSNLGADDQDTLDIILTASERCKGIVEKMLNYSHPSLAFVRADLAEIATDTLVLMDHQISGTGITVKGELRSAHAGHVVPGQISQVLANLLVNAKDAIVERTSADPGGDTGLITVRTGSLGGDVSLEVSDNGAGIPESILDRIFDPFFTTKDVGSGTGLGLWVSRGIVQKHGGTIQAESSPEGGTTFRVLIPSH
ncbi:MAG: GAF domain-containing protein [Armatimonadetes bacterium]|nr:GAF domain-containing protein [Armatimonadota bacterium]